MAASQTRQSCAATWQHLADIEISVPGFGRMTVEQLLGQISASDQVHSRTPGSEELLRADTEKRERL